MSWRVSTKEVVAVINRRPGTTLDRDAVKAEFGEDYEHSMWMSGHLQKPLKVISHMGGEDEVRQNEQQCSTTRLPLPACSVVKLMRVIVRN